MNPFVGGTTEVVLAAGVVSVALSSVQDGAFYAAIIGGIKDRDLRGGLELGVLVPV